MSSSGPADLVAIYRAEAAYVVRCLRRLGVATEDVEDAAHDVFVVVHRRLADYDPQRPVRPWLFGIALRVAARRGRSRQTAAIPTENLDVVDPAPAVDEQLAQNEARARALEALAVLDLDERAVLVLHDIDGLQASEVAETLGIPTNTVYSRLRRARAAFTAAARRRARGGSP